MGKFQHLMQQLVDPASLKAGIDAVLEASGPATHIAAEVNINELAVYQEPGLFDEVVKILDSPGEGRAAAAEAVLRLSRNDEVKALMAQNNTLLAAISTTLLSVANTAVHYIATNCCLCLQNISFPADGKNRVALMQANDGKVVEALCHCFSGVDVDDGHKRVRETSLSVFGNMAVTSACKKGMFEFPGVVKALLSVVDLGDRDSNNVIVREKALGILKNMANHADTKAPMFDFPGLLPSLMSVVSQTLSASKTHKEIALQVLQNIVNNSVSTPMKLLDEHSDLMGAIIGIIAARATDNNETARTNACLVLQNISFLEPCREKLYNYPGSFEALVSVLSNEEDTAKKNALPVLLNTSIATTVRVSMFKHSAFVPSLVKIVSNETGVVREKSLSILRNVANHEETKSPMFEHPEMIDTLMGVINTPLDAGTKLAREIALAVVQNISNNSVNPLRLIAKEGLMSTLYDVFKQVATEQNKVARENSLLVCQNLSFPNTTRAPLFQFDNGRFFDAILDVIYDESNEHNKEASEKALAAIANTTNEKENNLPMAQNSRFISKLVELCGTAGEPKRQGINILAKIAAGALFTAPYLLKAKGDLLSIMMAVVRDAGTDLKKWKKGNSQEFWALTFLMNLAQAEFSVPYMRVANVTKLMAPLVSQNSKESLQASATVAYLVGGDEDGEIFELLSTNLGAIDRIITLLENTLNCKGDGRGENGKSLDYGYGVFPLHSPLRAIVSLSKTDNFKSYLLEKGVLQKLHRCLRDFVENTGGGYVGGGGEDVESASLAVDALLELSYPEKTGVYANDKSAALHIVEKFSDPNMTSMPSLLEQYQTNYKVKTSEFFSSSVQSANSLSNRINLSSASKTTAMAAKMWKLAAASKEAKSVEEQQKEEKAKVEIEEAARLMEKQQKQYLLEQQKRDADLKRLELELQNEKDANHRTIVKMQKTLAEKDNEKNNFRADVMAQQMEEMKALMLSMHMATLAQTAELKAEIGKSEDKIMSKLDELGEQLSETTKKLQAGMEGAAAQAASNPALKEAIASLGEQIAAANQSQDGEFEKHLDAIQEAMKQAAKEACGGVQTAMEEALKETSVMRSDNADLKTIMKSLGGISSKIGNIDERMRSMEENLREGVEASRTSMKMLRGLTKRAAEDGKMPPRILWMYPKPEAEKKKGGWFSKPKEWMTHTVFVTFICPVTLKMAKCGPDGKGFEIQRAKQALTNAMPYIKGGLSMLKAGVGVGRVLGLPIPDLGEMASGVVNSIAGVEMEQIQGLMETCGVDLDFSGDLVDQLGTASDYIANEYAKSGTQICDMMSNIAGSGWEKKCGLVNVVANDGSCEWVLPEVVEEFVSKGALMLDGGSTHVGVSLQASPPEKSMPTKLRSQVKESSVVQADIDLETILTALKARAKKLKKEDKTAKAIFKALAAGEGGGYNMALEELDGSDLSDVDGRWSDLVELFED